MNQAWRWMVPLAIVTVGRSDGAAEPPTRVEIRIPSQPALSPDGRRLAFEWKGDLWIAPSTGGEARVLAPHPAPDFSPAFSPGGDEIAFISQRDDTAQIHIVPAAGGTPEQITWHSEGFKSVQWLPDGRRLLARAVRDASGFDDDRLVIVDRTCRRAEAVLFDDYAGDADISPDGGRVLFTREGVDPYRVGYRGSTASQVWIHDAATGRFLRPHPEPTPQRLPLWRPDGRAFYFAGGAGGDLVEFDLDTGAARTLAAGSNAPIAAAGLSDDGSVLVFRRGFEFERIDPRTPGAPVRVPLWTVDTPPPLREMRRWYETVWNLSAFGSVDFTPNGLQIVFTAGGDVWAMDTVVREPRQVTSGTLDFDTEAAFSTDSASLYFLRDDGLGINLWRATRSNPAAPWWQAGPLGAWTPQTNAGGRTWVQHDAFRLEPLTGDRLVRRQLKPSPDGSKLCWVEGLGNVVVASTNGTDARIVARSPIGAMAAWAPDGRWLACSLHDSSGNSDVWIVSADGSREPFNLSRNPADDRWPAWSPDGRIVAYTGRTYDNETSIYYAWLSREDADLDERGRKIEKALESAAGKAAPKKDKAADGDKKGGDARKPVRIDFEGLADRVRRVKLPGCVPENLFWSFDSKALAFHGTVGGKRATHRINFPDPGAATLVHEKTGTQARWVAEGGGKILWLVDGKPAAAAELYPFSALHTIDWREHQRLGFRMAWRELRERFYDERLNGLDWEAVRLEFEEEAAGAADEDSFARVIRMMIGRLNASHMGWTPEKKAWTSGQWRLRTAHLGVRFDPAFAGPGLRVRDVLPGGPADRAGSRLAAGDVIRAIDGAPVGPGMDLATLLNGRWPRDVRLDVGPADGAARTIDLPTIGYDEARPLVRRKWIDDNRRLVSALSSNTLGYLNIERMQLGNLRQFERDVYAEGLGKDGLVIDVRNNPGGFISEHLLSILCHPRYAVTVPRGGEPSFPEDYLGKVVWTKPIVVLCNQRTGSNSEIFCHAIRALRRGRIVGVPGEGAVIATPDQKILDLGTLKVPTRGWFTLAEGQDMELYPVVPDVVVWPEPGEIPAGRDRQIEAAVSVLLEDVATARASPGPPLIRASERR
jgi:tricorn protease